ncbi:MAG: lasso peptide biosynthesis B2 protein [Syntrophorhabdus sp.]
MDKPTSTSHNGCTYYLSPYVRYVDIADRVTILDIRSESYFALEPLASMMWKELAAGHTHTQCLDTITRQGTSDDPELADNLASFAQQCVDTGLLTLTADAPPSAKVKRRIPGIRKRFASTRAWLSLARTTLSLSRKGFFKTYTDALNIPALYAVTDRDSRTVERAVSAFSRAENFFHLKKAPLDCLPRSLALFVFLRTSGLPAEHCIGVRQFPFTAHAWTECNGHVVHDDPLNQENFSVIARISL